MADDYEDVSGAYTPEGDVTSQDIDLSDLDARLTDKVKAAMLAQEAMKKEEAALEESWRTSGKLAATPQIGQFGQVMPASRGFMYMGGAPAAPPPEMARQSGLASGLIVPPSPAPGTPQADIAALSEMIARRPDTETSRTIAARTGVPEPPKSTAEQQFYAQEGYRSDIARGMSVQEATAKWVPLGLYGASVSAGTRMMTTPYQQQQLALRQSEFAQRQQAAATKAQAAVTGRQESQLEKEIAAERAEINKLELQQTSTPGPIGTPDPDSQYARLSYLLNIHRGRLESLEKQAAGKPAAPLVTPPGGTATATTPPPAAAPAAPKALPPTKAEMVKGQRYTVKGKTYVWNGEKLILAK